MKHTTVTVLALGIAAMLVSCGGNDSLSTDKSSTDLHVSGAKSAIYSALLSLDSVHTSAISLPSAPLSVYVGIFVAQGRLQSVLGALESVDTQIKLIRSDESIERDETFALLQDYGTILQVDIIDTLNRSIERDRVLTEYTSALEAMSTRVESKIHELEQKVDTLNDKRREQRSVVRDIERDIRDAERDGNYTRMGQKQQELTPAKGTLAATETQERQTKRVLNAYENLLEIGQERIVAIVSNREVILAGLQVVNVPGIEDLQLILD